MERSGAAQGLSEVLAVLGPEYLAGLLPDILASCGAKAAVAREGSLTLFKFLPLAMPDECQASATCFASQPWLCHYCKERPTLLPALLASSGVPLTPYS